MSRSLLLPALALNDGSILSPTHTTRFSIYNISLIVFHFYKEPEERVSACELARQETIDATNFATQDRKKSNFLGGFFRILFYLYSSSVCVDPNN